MRLIDLSPRWFSLEFGGARVGLTFYCPHCPRDLSVRIGVVFHRQGYEAVDDVYIKALQPKSNKYIWTLSGTGFDDLTITPSIDASKEGHWHGFVRNGEIA